VQFVAQDNSSVWVDSRMGNCVYAYSLPDLKLRRYVLTQYDAMWMSFTPDSLKLYIANNGAGSVSVIDNKGQKSTGHHPSWASAEAEHHGDASVRSTSFRSDGQCMRPKTT